MTINGSIEGVIRLACVDRNGVKTGATFAMTVAPTGGKGSIEYSLVIPV